MSLSYLSKQYIVITIISRLIDKVARDHAKTQEYMFIFNVCPRAVCKLIINFSSLHITYNDDNVV